MFHRRYLATSVLAALALLLCSCISENQARPTPYQRYPVTVNYDQSIEDLIKAGSYYRVYSEITSKNFPTEAGGTKELLVALVKLQGLSSISQLVTAQAKLGLRPATIKEVLTFGETYPELLKRLTIVGLGSSREYSVTTYRRFSMDPNDVDMDVSLQPFYPSFAWDLFGLALVLIQEDMIPSFDPGGFYGCFVAEE